MQLIMQSVGWLEIRMFTIIFVTLVTPLLADHYLDVSAVMSPSQDLFVCIGGGFEMNCTVNGTWIKSGDHENETLPDPNTSLSVYNITIKKLNENLDRGVFTYHEEEQTLQLNMYNVVKNDAGAYFCRYQNEFKSMKYVHVGVPPGTPDPPVCVSYKFLDMVCYVNISEPNDNIPYNWTMEFRTAGHGPWSILPLTLCTTDQYKCQWTSRNKPHTDFIFQPLVQYYYVRVTVENRLAYVSSDVVMFAPWDIGGEGLGEGKQVFKAGVSCKCVKERAEETGTTSFLYDNCKDLASSCSVLYM